MDLWSIFITTSRHNNFATQLRETSGLISRNNSAKYSHFLQQTRKMWPRHTFLTHTSRLCVYKARALYTHNCARRSRNTNNAKHTLRNSSEMWVHLDGPTSPRRTRVSEPNNAKHKLKRSTLFAVLREVVPWPQNRGKQSILAYFPEIIPRAN